MEKRKVFCLLIAVVICFALTVSASFAAEGEIKPQIVQVAPRLLGQLYLPDAESECKNIGILIMHPNSHYFDHPMAIPMSRRGFTVLVSNTRYTGHDDGDVFWDDAALDVKSAFEYLKAVPGVDKIILIGHSGGGPLSAFYQNIAENGAKAGQGKEKILPVSDKLDGLPKADALILLDSHLGSGFASLVNKDPSVTAEGAIAPETIDESFNMYLEQNGFSAQGSAYDENWKKKFFAAQAARNQRILEQALERVGEIDKGNGSYPDTEPIIVPRNYARLFLCDLTLLSHTKGKYPILTVNGVKEDVARSIRSQGVNKEGKMAGESDNKSYSDGVLVTDVRTYLSSYSIRADSGYQLTEDDIIGVDFASANTSAPANLEGVTVPVLNMSMTAHYWVVPSEVNHNHTAAADKTLVYVEGASHGLTPSRPEYGDTVGMIADYARDWLLKRFK